MNAGCDHCAKCPVPEALARRVLVVDDDESLNHLAKKALRRSGFEADGVLTGADCIERVLGQPGLTLLLDHRLPDMDGTEIIRTLTSRGVRIPFVAFTGEGNEQLAVEMMKLGAKDYLVKGANAIELLPEVFQRVFREMETERRLALSQQKLRESEERFRTVADYTYAWEYWLAPDGALKWVSPSCDLLTGHSADAFMADPGLLRTIVHPEDVPVYDEHMKVAMPEGAAPQDLDFRIVSREGRVVWVNHTCVSITGSDGIPLGRRASNKDITDRKHAESALTRELAVNRATSELSTALIARAATMPEIAAITLHYAKLMTGSSDGFAGVVAAGSGNLECPTLTQMTSAQCRVAPGLPAVFPPGQNGRYPSLWGHALNTRRPFFTNDPASHPSSGGSPEGHIPLHNFLAVPAMRDDASLGLIALANAPDGYSDKDLEIVQRLAGLYAVAVDRQATVTALRASEQQIRGLFNASTDSVMLVDRSAEILAVNEWGAKRRGLAQADMTGRNLKEFLPEKTFAKRLEAMGESARSQDWVDIEEVWDSNQYHVRIYPISDDEGAIKQFAVFSRDVTERKRMQAVLVEAEKTTSIAGMAAGMAHEIRNPLSGVMQGAQVISNRLTGDLPANQMAAAQAGCSLEGIRCYVQSRKIDELVAGIHESAVRMAQIVSNMLEFSRKSEGQLVFCEVEKLLEKSLELCAADFDLEKKYDFRNIRIVREYAGGLPLVPCTPNQIEQVLTNLLRNAAQAMSPVREGGPEPVIALRTGAEDGMARIEIEDNGPGMEEDVLKHIFDPFFTTKSPGEGTGLGLSVSHFIIANNHDGSIKAQSWPGRGTRFTLRLPLERKKGRPTGAAPV